MTEPEKETQPVAPVAQGPDVKANFSKLPLLEKVLAIIALVVVIGWIIGWSSKKMPWEISGLFKSWFGTLSFFGSLAIVALVGLKVGGIRPLPPNLENMVIPIASLLPVVGYVLEVLFDFPFVYFLIMTGSLALAYLSATTYWRKSIPDIVTKPLGDAPTQESKPAQ